MIISGIDKHKQLRDLFSRKGIIRIVGVHNPMGAKLIEKYGFEGIWVSGCELATSYGLPDANILSISQILDITSKINDATSLPVILDGDTGHGGINNVIYMVKQLEKNKICGVVIEDKCFPKINSFVDAKHNLVPISEFVAKIRAAKDACQSNGLMIFARVEALIVGLGMEEALKRAEAYAMAGADGIFIHSKSKTSNEIIEFVTNFNRDNPIIVCPTTYPEFNLDKIKQIPSIKMVIYANCGIRAQIMAMNSMLNKLSNTNNLKTVEADICSMDEVFELQGMSAIKEYEKKFYHES